MADCTHRAPRLKAAARNPSRSQACGRSCNCYISVCSEITSASGSTLEEIREAIAYGVVKMNIDTDLQWAFWDGIKEYYRKNEGYLQGQIGNPDGDDKPNKKFYDPRAWMRKGEESFKARLKQVFADLNNIGTLA